MSLESAPVPEPAPQHPEADPALHMNRPFPTAEGMDGVIIKGAKPASEIMDERMGMAETTPSVELPPKHVIKHPETYPTPPTTEQPPMPPTSNKRIDTPHLGW